jgi:hypothetical protein
MGIGRPVGQGGAAPDVLDDRRARVPAGDTVADDPGEDPRGVHLQPGVGLVVREVDQSDEAATAPDLPVRQADSGRTLLCQRFERQ